MTDAALVAEMDTSELEEVRALLREYAESLPFALDFQDFDRELEELPGAYAPPRGALLVARLEGKPVGCVALRPLIGGTCEMKRLFVRPSARGHGLGRLLATAVVDEARRCGYTHMRLDTTPGMDSAQLIYEELGFQTTEPYTHNPVPGTRFLQLDL